MAAAVQQSTLHEPVDHRIPESGADFQEQRLYAGGRAATVS